MSNRLTNIRNSFCYPAVHPARKAIASDSVASAKLKRRDFGPASGPAKSDGDHVELNSYERSGLIAVADPGTQFQCDLGESVDPPQHDNALLVLVAR